MLACPRRYPGPREAPGEGSWSHARGACGRQWRGAEDRPAAGRRMVTVRARGGMCAHVAPSEGCLCF